mgnify:CR=1 FL=1
MKRKTVVAALILMAASPVLAQTGQSADATETVEYSADKYKVETNRFWSNWFISVGAGAQVYFGDHDKQAEFGKRISPALDIAVGKWFTPGIGVRLMYSGLSAKGATGRYESGGLVHATGEVVPGWKDAAGGELQYSKFNYFNFHADVLFNLSNLFCGYNEKRIYNCNIYGGVGVMHVSESPSATDVSGHFGLLNTFRLCSALDLNLDLRGTIMNDDFDGEIGGRGEGMFAATIGLTYKFKPRGWDRSKTITRTVYNNEEINAMRERINRMSEENARLEQALAEGKQDEAMSIVKQIASTNFITFQIDKSELSNEARVNLGMLAEVIKQGEPSTVYTITGYADEGTGSKKGNEKLSKARAEAVYNCLVNEFGVDKSQLKVEYKGGVENMFYDDPRLSRAVITRSN